MLNNADRLGYAIGKISQTKMSIMSNYFWYTVIVIMSYSDYVFVIVI